MLRRSLPLACLGLLAVVVAACGSKASSSPPTPALEDPSDWMDDLKEDATCILDCDPSCTEAATPWSCPALAPWSTIPHDPTACGSFDGTTYPTPQQGQCAATAPTGVALEKTNASGTPVILPDGRRLDPAGNEWLFTDFPGNFPDGAILVPGTSWLLVVDTGYTTHAVRAIDTSLLRASPGTNPVASSIRYQPPKALNWGMAYVPTSSVLYVASGYEDPDDTDSQIFAYDFDFGTGQLTADAAKSVPLPSGTFPQGIAVSPDGQTLLVGQVTDSHVLVVSLASATYGTVTGKIDVGQDDVFELRFDPDDATGNTAYATLWVGPATGTESTSMRVTQLDVSARTSQSIAVGKEPEDMVFLDARYMVVGNGMSDSLAIIDRPASKVAATVQLGTVGLEPTSLAYDAPNARLYATLASANAIQVFDVDDTQTPPSLTPVGRIPTSWWPTAVVADTDGTLYVTCGRGHGTQGLNVDGDDGTYLQGSIQAIPFMDSAALAAATTTAETDAVVQSYAGYSTVQCNGAPYDFPVPATPDQGPRPLIQHVFFIERENKTFDALFGDLAGVDGDPGYILSPQYQSSIWANARKVASTFSHLDNYYTDAEQSIQGHYWDVFGRTSDFDERRWLVTWGRGEFSSTDSAGVSDYSAPLEGSIFSSLMDQGVTIENDGELVGGIAYRNIKWPGGTSSTTVPDTLGGCYLAARSRVTCDVPQFVYAWMGNDHTFGLSAGYPNPALMMAVNDEATGMLIDGISHSPIWASSLVIVIEDDPSTGQDHVDMHRSIALFASPWVKHGYVSHAHYDMASVHKLLSNLYGKPYRNAGIANAPLPLDVFTSTPDYTPYDYVPRAYSDGSCNPSGTKGARRAQGWDFRRPDEQPGLDRQLQEYLRALK
jgi:DNA-binding beta-propeller fold protein YncE